MLREKNAARDTSWPLLLVWMLLDPLTLIKVIDSMFEIAGNLNRDSGWLPERHTEILSKLELHLQFMLRGCGIVRFKSINGNAAKFEL